MIATVTIQADALEISVRTRDEEGNWTDVDPVPPFTERSYGLGALGQEITFATPGLPAE